MIVCVCTTCGWLSADQLKMFEHLRKVHGLIDIVDRETKEARKKRIEAK